MDRNNRAVKQLAKDNGSLSARRAWIEIAPNGPKLFFGIVALRKESVDRNHDDMLRYRDAEQSLSARRAWIEITNRYCCSVWRSVALRKESVDRNTFCLAAGNMVI